MSKNKEAKNLVVGLDIGTSKIVVIVGEAKPDGMLEVIGMGMHQSSGHEERHGGQYRSHGGRDPARAGGGRADGGLQDTRGLYRHRGQPYPQHQFARHGEDQGEGSRAPDIERVIETASSISLPGDQQILHILEQEFSIDGQDGIKKPLGMSGMRLDVEVHIVSGAVSAVQNIMKCIHRCGLEVNELILQPLASSKAVLAEDEKELGVCLVDIGGGTTDIAVFTGGAIRHTAVIPIAGDQITNDIAMALRTPTQDAEDIKIKHGCALRQLADGGAIEVPGVGDRGPRMLSRQTLAEVIEPRVEELYSLVQQELRRSGFEELLSSGIVITGGSSAMQGMVELGEEIFHLPVRMGIREIFGGLSDVVKTPRYGDRCGAAVVRVGTSSAQ